jgi:hypothetical protein
MNGIAARINLENIIQIHLSADWEIDLKVGVH